MEIISIKRIFLCDPGEKIEKRILYEQHDKYENHLIDLFQQLTNKSNKPWLIW